MKKKSQTRILTISAGVLIGAAAFFFICNPGLLNPLNVGWVFPFGDSAPHFLGWHFFRSEPWTAPPGRIEGYCFPRGTSLVFTDSIPLLAMPLKFFDRVLPDPLQYLGLWLLLSYMLMGFFSSLLLWKFIRKPLPVILGTCFFVLSPIMAQRTFAHESLTAHWLIPAALYLYFNENKLSNQLRWILLVAVSMLVHFYLAVMVIFLLMVYVVRSLLTDFKNRIGPMIAFLATSLAVALFTMWLSGYFINSNDMSDPAGFGYYSMNLLQPLNPTPMKSAFFRPVTLGVTGQYEGFNYLGLGAVLLIIAGTASLLTHLKMLRPKRDLPLIAACFILTLFALSNKITYADIVLLKIPLSESIMSFVSIFRSSGRFFWPVTYILLFGSVTIVSLRHKNVPALMILIAALLLQVADLYPYYRTRDKGVPKWESPLESPLWDDLAKKYDHLALIPPVAHLDDYAPFAMLAARHDKTINTAYLARDDYHKVMQYRRVLVKQFENGLILPHTLYILKNGEKALYEYQVTDYTDNPKYTAGVLDGYPVFCHRYDQPTPGLRSFPASQIKLEKDGPELTITQLVEKYQEGYAIFMAVRDDAVVNINPEFVDFMESMGSRMRHLGFRDSYTGIIRHGKIVGEKINQDGPVRLIYEHFPWPVQMYSAGMDYGDVAAIVVNGKNFSLNERGFNVVLLNEKTGVLRRYHFDTCMEKNPVASPE